MSFKWVRSRLDFMHVAKTHVPKELFLGTYNFRHVRDESKGLGRSSSNSLLRPPKGEERL